MVRWTTGTAKCCGGLAALAGSPAGRPEVGSKGGAQENGERSETLRKNARLRPVVEAALQLDVVAAVRPHNDRRHQLGLRRPAAAGCRQRGSAAGSDAARGGASGRQLSRPYGSCHDTLPAAAAAQCCGVVAAEPRQPSIEASGSTRTPQTRSARTRCRRGRAHRREVWVPWALAGCRSAASRAPGASRGRSWLPRRRPRSRRRGARRRRGAAPCPASGPAAQQGAGSGHWQRAGKAQRRPELSGGVGRRAGGRHPAHHRRPGPPTPMLRMLASAEACCRAVEREHSSRFVWGRRLRGPTLSSECRYRDRASVLPWGPAGGPCCRRLSCKSLAGQMQGPQRPCTPLFTRRLLHPPHQRPRPAAETGLAQYGAGGGCQGAGGPAQQGGPVLGHSGHRWLGPADLPVHRCGMWGGSRPPRAPGARPGGPTADPGHQECLGAGSGRGSGRWEVGPPLLPPLPPPSATRNLGAPPPLLQSMAASGR